MWLVVDGDLSVCQAYVEATLNPPLAAWEECFDEIVQTVCDSLIAP